MRSYGLIMLIEVDHVLEREISQITRLQSANNGVYSVDDYKGLTMGFQCQKYS